MAFKSSHKNNAKAKGLREIPKSCIFLSKRVGCGNVGDGDADASFTCIISNLKTTGVELVQKDIQPSIINVQNVYRSCCNDFSQKHFSCFEGQIFNGETKVSTNA